MKTITDEQAKVIKAALAFCADQDYDSFLDAAAEELGIDAETRGQEDDEGNDNEDYDQNEDPVHKEVENLKALVS